MTNMKNVLNKRVDGILPEYKDKNEHETKFRETLKELRTYEPPPGESTDEEKLRAERRERMKSSPTVESFDELSGPLRRRRKRERASGGLD